MNKNGTNQAVSKVSKYLKTSVCSDCPSADRWAREMLEEQALVNQARHLGKPVEEFVSSHSKRTPPSFQMPPDRNAQRKLIDVKPPSKWDLVRSYLKAKIPHVLGFRLDPNTVAMRKLKCTNGSITCGNCNRPANFVDVDVIVCSHCNKRYAAPASMEKIGQPCQFLKQQGGGLFCGACGCGYRRDANLAIKTEMVYAVCVKNFWPTDRRLRWQLGISLVSMTIGRAFRTGRSLYRMMMSSSETPPKV